MSMYEQAIEQIAKSIYIQGSNLTPDRALDNWEHNHPKDKYGDWRESYRERVRQFLSENIIVTDSEGKEHTVRLGLFIERAKPVYTRDVIESGWVKELKEGE